VTKTLAAPETPVTLAPLDAARAAVEEANRVLDQVQQQRLALDCREALFHRLSTLQLPDPIRDRIHDQWTFQPGRWRSLQEFREQLDCALILENESFDQLQATVRSHPAFVRGMGSPNGQVEITVSPIDRQRTAAQVAMDRLFGVAESMDDPHYRDAVRFGIASDIPTFTGIREAYAKVTGDALVSGIVYPAASIVREANEVTSGVLNHVLLNSISKRLTQDFRSQPQDWRRFVHVRAIPNYKPQDRIKLHDFSSLSVVPEGGAYPNLPWDDLRELYTPAKRGNLVVVTREVIMNDDLQAVERIPSKLATAAGITINEFVFGLFTSNPQMNDASKVFDDGVQTTHANRGTSPLSATSLRAAITTVMKQTNAAGKRLHLKPRFLLVPADLLFDALTLVKSPLVPGSPNNDVNVLQNTLEVIAVPQFTDPTDWYLVCDPAHVETIEVGFVMGRETPELLLQSNPSYGQVFTHDQISFKVRWEFGGAWIDYRGAFWSQVAG
jgi:hypothetical protein